MFINILSEHACKGSPQTTIHTQLCLAMDHYQLEGMDFSIVGKRLVSYSLSGTIMHLIN